jgi:hypothetical protein
MKHLKSFFFDQAGRFFGRRRRSYETTSKWHGFLDDKTGSFDGRAWIKQQTD